MFFSRLSLVSSTSLLRFSFQPSQHLFSTAQGTSSSLLSDNQFVDVDFFFTCYKFFLSSILTLSSPRSLSLLLFLSNSSYVMTLHECWTINWCSPIDYIDTLYIEMYVQFHTYWYKKHTHAKRQSFISVTYSHIRISFLSLKATLLSYFIQSYKCVFLNIIFCSLAH